MYKVRIKSLPRAAYGQQVQGALNVNPTSFGGRDFNESMSRMNPASTRKTLTAVPREEANLEAEGGETAFGPISGQNIPDHMVIKGNRHSKGGVPLNLPDDTFIFSDTKSMKITDPNILAMFGKNPKKGGYTPAELAKPYDINKYKAILMDPDTDKQERNTAEMMIKNFIMKLGALALAQEAKKGFPQGIPAMARPYMEANGISEEQLIPELAQQQQPAPQGQQQLPPAPSQMPSGEPVAQPMSEQEMMAMQGQGMMAYGGSAAPMAAYGMMMGGYGLPYYNNQMAYGGVPKFENGGPGDGNKNSRPMTEAELRAKIAQQKEWERKRGTACGPGYVLIDGKCVKGSYSDWKQPGSDLGQAKGTYTGQRSTAWEDTICNQLKKGVDPQELVNKGHAASVEALKKRFPECFEQGQKLITEGKDESFEGYELYQDETTEKKLCECKDPNTGEVYTFEISLDEECICPDGSQGEQVGFPPIMDNPMWSDVATRNVLTQATMDPNAGRLSIQRMPYQETRPAFEDYLAKTQAIQSDLAQSQDQISTFAGSTADQMAGVLRAQAEANKMNLQNVADVQARNINYLNAAEAGDLQARMAGDQMNAQLALQEQMYNVGARDRETTARNQIKQNTQMAIADAETEMQKRALSNMTHPEFATEYRSGLPYFAGMGRTPYPEKPAKTPAEEYNELLEAGLPETVAGQIAAKHAKYGYVMGSNVFPFML